MSFTNGVTTTINYTGWDGDRSDPLKEGEKVPKTKLPPGQMYKRCRYCGTKFISFRRTNIRYYCCRQHYHAHIRESPKIFADVRRRARATLKENYEKGLRYGFRVQHKEQRKIVPKKIKCRDCGSKKDLRVHHIDSNRSNHLTTNLEVLCRSCHHEKHLWPYMEITKKFKFHSAHSLFGMGKCERLHGHSYKMEVAFGGRLNRFGVIQDYSSISEIVEKELISKLDHWDLNDLMDIPSAEYLCLWIFSHLSAKVKGLKSVTVWETENSSAKIENEFFLKMMGE